MKKLLLRSLRDIHRIVPRTLVLQINNDLVDVRFS